MIETVVFATALSGSILATQPGDTGKEAVNNLAIATYRYTGLDDTIEPFVKGLERKYVPKVIREAGISTYFVYRLVHDKQIAYTWSF